MFYRGPKTTLFVYSQNISDARKSWHWDNLGTQSFVLDAIFTRNCKMPQQTAMAYYIGSSCLLTTSDQVADPVSQSGWITKLVCHQKCARITTWRYAWTLRAGNFSRAHTSWLSDVRPHTTCTRPDLVQAVRGGWSPTNFKVGQPDHVRHKGLWVQSFWWRDSYWLDLAQISKCWTLKS